MLETYLKEYKTYGTEKLLSHLNIAKWLSKNSFVNIHEVYASCIIDELKNRGVNGGFCS